MNPLKRKLTNLKDHPRQLANSCFHDQTSEEYIHQAEAAGQEDETTATPPPQAATAEPEDKPTTQASKKPKYD